MHEKTRMTSAGSMLGYSKKPLSEASKATQEDVAALVGGNKRLLMGVACSKENGSNFTVASVSFCAWSLDGGISVGQIRCEAKSRNYDRNDVWKHAVVEPIAAAVKFGITEVLIATEVGWLSQSIGNFNEGAAVKGQEGWSIRWRQNGWTSRTGTAIVQRDTAEALLASAESLKSFHFVHNGPIFNRMYPLAEAVLNENSFARLDSIGEQLAPKARGRSIIRIPRAVSPET